MLILLASHAYAYNAGRGRAEAACNAAALQSQVDALKRDLAAAQASERIAAGLANQARVREETLKERLSNYEQSIAGGEPDICLLGPADVDSLRGLVR
ncbi:hypothetical protein [Devosia ginsengisoli]|uniref:hypothetical protein n=1 Tax=Devosia ginsengisoli TaxID=400770 RepID=UPI0026ED920E|nr:hypothetical protein [Devosia ginsengisoli]MCR6673216.1 hypothetical protein [Devosia ginsengisoli]